MTGGAGLVATGLAKAFGVTPALVHADLEVKPGEVHTLAGENGSGKSTLVKILAGVHRPDAGSLLVGGQPADQQCTPARARRLGVATVFQEVLTASGRTVGENITLGAPRTLGARTAEGRRRAGELVSRLLGEPVDLDGPVDALSLSERQACCVARSLLVDPQVLVLDESTSALDIATRDRLFEVVRELTAQGVGVVFISHRMDEVFAITDVVSVLRSGTTVAHRLPIGEVTSESLVSMMSGSDHQARPVGRRSVGASVLRAKGVTLRQGAQPVDLEICAGELVGLAGLEGQGQATFLNALRGHGLPAGTVRRVHGGDETVVDGPISARRLGISYVPRERRHAALFEQLSIRENFALPTMRRDTVAGVLRPARSDARLSDIGDRLRLRIRRASDPVTTLSGGNQQKVVLSRALADRPQVLLLDDPTRGIDLSAKQDVYEVLAALCAEGTAVVMVSSEVDELVELADRVVVFRDDEVSVVIEREDLDRARIVAGYFGVRSAGIPDPDGSTTNGKADSVD